MQVFPALPPSVPGRYVAGTRQVTFSPKCESVSILLAAVVLLLLVTGPAEEPGVVRFLQRSHPVAEPGLDHGSVCTEIPNLSGGCR